MTSQWRPGLLALSMVVFLGLVSACGGPSDSKLVTLTVAQTSEPDSLDPALVQNQNDRRVVLALFEGLVVYDPKTCQPVPGLAESWSLSPDKTVVTFKLRPAVWSDSTPITADTFVASWQRAFDPETASPVASSVAFLIKGAAESLAAPVTAKVPPSNLGVRAVDPSTLEVTLTGPHPFAVQTLAQAVFAPVPLHVVKKFARDWVKPGNLVTSGPYVLKEWKPKTQLVLTKSPTYWDKDQVKLDQLVFLPVENADTAYQMFVKKDVDWLTPGTVPLANLAELRLNPAFRSPAQWATWYFTFNTTKPPFNNPKVRAALSLAVDRQILADKVTQGAVLPAYSLVPGLPEYLVSPGLGFDPVKAKALLTEAGYSETNRVPAFKILFNSLDQNRRICEFLQQEWTTKLGLEVTLEEQAWDPYLEARRTRNFDVARAGWLGDVLDPVTFLDLWTTGANSNETGYTNPDYDRLLDQAAAAAGIERLKLLKQAEDLLLADQPLLPVFFYASPQLIDTQRWQGWFDNILDLHPYKAVSRLP